MSGNSVKKEKKRLSRDRRTLWPLIFDDHCEISRTEFFLFFSDGSGLFFGQRGKAVLWPIARQTQNSRLFFQTNRKIENPADRVLRPVTDWHRDSRVDSLWSPSSPPSTKVLNTKG